MHFETLVISLQNSSSLADFDTFLEENLTDIRNLIYAFSDDEVIGLQISQFYDKVFITSAPFREFDQTNKPTDLFLSFIIILAALYERHTKLTGLSGNLENLQSILPPTSSLKYRLKAISKINNIDNIRIDYIKHFLTVLTLLDKAYSIEDEDHLSQIADVLLYYYNKGKKNLLDKNYIDENDAFKSLFLEPETQVKFSFLTFPALQNLIQGRTSYELLVKPVSKGVLYPSELIYNFFYQRIVEPVKVASTHGWPNILLGFPKNEVLQDILERGRTDFNVPYKNLSVDDKVSLYCYFNMRKHYFTSYSVFNRLKDSLLEVFSQVHIRPIFIDLGCGPLTSGLALAEFYRQETGTLVQMAYIGIDRAGSMIDKAKSLVNSQLFGPNCFFEFHENWRMIQDSTLLDLIGENNPIFVNASYLFSSISLNENDLASFVRSLLNMTQNVFFIYQNPNRDDRNIKYCNFKEQLAFEVIDNHTEKVLYKTDPYNAFEPAYEEVFLEVLKLK
ncbi:hypothetical protein [Spirosoma gilvum]